MNSNVDLYLKAKAAYYNGSPIMSDEQFDMLEEEIRKQNPEEACLKMVGSPVNNTQPKLKHLIPMGSQSKVKSFEELVRWERLRKNDRTQRFHASFKGDGGSIAVYYEKGVLVSCGTRGGDNQGQNITLQATHFQGIPKTLPEPITIGVRCEAVTTIADWPKADPEKKTNPRNVATGILGRLDTQKARWITALGFDLEATSECERTKAFLAGLKTESACTETLRRLGFMNPEWRGNLTLEEVKEFFEETQKKREAESLPYWIDGIVVRYEDLAIQKELGMTDGKPKGQVAWKFPAKGAWTRLISVEDQVGHTGAVTPVGWVEPVRIGGTTVRKASLANYDNIKTLGARIGGKVKVVKAGDIIPMIVECEGGEKEITTPSNCPVCQTSLVYRKNVDGGDSVVLLCPNASCEARTQGKIRRFCESREILGLGDSIINALLNDMAIQTVDDLYTLTPEKIENTIINTEKGVRLGRKRADAICQEIQEKATEMSLVEFLGAFGTRGLGVRRATLMAEANPDLNDLEKWFDGSLAEEKFAERAGVPKMGAQILEGLKDYEYVIRETLTHVRLVEKKKETNAQTICITGSLPSGKKKKDYAGPLTAAGYTLVEELSKGVSYLVVANPNGEESSKTKKAKKLGIPLIDETALEAIIAGAPQDSGTKDARNAELIQEAFRYDG